MLCVIWREPFLRHAMHSIQVIINDNFDTCKSGRSLSFVLLGAYHVVDFCFTRCWSFATWLGSELAIATGFVCLECTVSKWYMIDKETTVNHYLHMARTETIVEMQRNTYSNTTTQIPATNQLFFNFIDSFLAFFLLRKWVIALQWPDKILTDTKAWTVTLCSFIYQLPLKCHNWLQYIVAAHLSLLPLPLLVQWDRHTRWCVFFSNDYVIFTPTQSFNTSWPSMLCSNILSRVLTNNSEIMDGL